MRVQKFNSLNVKIDKFLLYLRPYLKIVNSNYYFKIFLCYVAIVDIVEIPNKPEFEKHFSLSRFLFEL